MSEFGPFVNLMALVTALVAVFGALVSRSIGPLDRWTSLVEDAPSFMVAVGPRLLAVALIAASYLLADQLSGAVFAVLALIAACLGYFALRSFDRLRRRNSISIPVPASDGTQALDEGGRPRFRVVAVGTESQLRDDVAEHYREARREVPGLTLAEFMSGYGSPPNNPSSLWPESVLVTIQMAISGRLMQVVLAGSMTLYWAALAMDMGL